jgi:thymidylate synthase ThyX
MRIRSPLIKRSTYEEEMREVVTEYNDMLARMEKAYDKALQEEYRRALREGKQQLHRMAVDMTYRVFLGETIQWRAFLQELETYFKPKMTDIADVEWH